MANLRDPIQTTLLPRPVTWKKASLRVEERYGDLTPDGFLEIPVASSEMSPTHLRSVDRLTGRPISFIRVVRGADRREVEFCAHVTRTLVSAGIPTPDLLDVLDRNGDCVMIYGWAEGVYPLSRQLDFQALGRAVALFQSAIAPLEADFPLAVKTQSRIEQLMLVQAGAMAAADWPAWAHTAEAAENIRRFTELCGRMAKEAVPTHGDLNAANIIDADGSFIFLDFEDIRHMRVWWGFDIAKLIERLILTRHDALGPDWVRTAFRNLLVGYLAAAPVRAQARQGLGTALVEAMRWHVALSMLVVQGSDYNRPALAAEQAKLASLAALIEAKAELLLEAD